MEVEVRGLWKGRDGTVYGYCTCGREVKNRVNFESGEAVSGSGKESIENISESVKESRDDILRCPMCKATLIWPKFAEKSL